MVNLPKLSTLFFAYDLKSIAYKPTPGSISASVAASSSGVDSSSTGNVHGISLLNLRSSKSHSKKKKKAVKPVKSMKILDAATPDACAVQPYSPPPISDQVFPPYDQTSANVYRYRQQQSVNLGSWFVHEKWMTPSLFTCASGSQGAEIDIAFGWGAQDNAKAVLGRHWDTFIQASDFTYLASIGINTVRLPIGYWCLAGVVRPDYLQATAFEAVAAVYDQCWPRIVRAIVQAGNAGIGVLVDMHGAVGSQNGQQHSGISDGQTGLFSSPANMDRTIEGLTVLAERLAEVNNVVGIQILNEPVYDDGLEDFYTRAITAMRAASPNAKSLPLYLHDGFDIDRFSNYVSARKDFIVQDHHSYFVFTPSDQQTPVSQQIDNVHGAIANSLTLASGKERRNLIVGEWSCALTPTSLSNEKDAVQVQKNFCEAQMSVYANTTAGWSFWAYNKEDCDNDQGWCFKAAVGKSLPSTFFSYGTAGSANASNAALAAVDATSLFMPTVAKTYNMRRTSHHRQPSLLRRLVESISRNAVYKPRSTPHRFETISTQQCNLRRNYHHQPSTSPSSAPQSQKPSPSATSDVPPPQSTSASADSRTKGHTDGLTTAKVFAQYNMSKLGFIGQFIQDAIAVSGPAGVASGTEDQYSEGFLQGLREGEAAAAAALR